jgi:hypothetical protein
VGSETAERGENDLAGQQGQQSVIIRVKGAGLAIIRLSGVNLHSYVPGSGYIDDGL